MAKSQSVTLTGGPAVTSCFGFTRQALNIWWCFELGLSASVCPGSKQITAGRELFRSDYYTADMVYIGLVLSKQSVCGGEVKPGVPVYDSVCLQKRKKRKEEEKMSGHLKRG